MNKQELLDILKIQSILGRTKKGWDIGKEILTVSSGSILSIDQKDFILKECSNCELILSAEFFSAGCPNCGSKDHKDIQIGEQEIKKPID